MYVILEKIKLTPFMKFYEKIYYIIYILKEYFYKAE